MATLNQRFANIILRHYIITTFRFQEKPVFVDVSKSSCDLMYEETAWGTIQLARGFNETILALRLFDGIFEQLDYQVTDFGSPNTQKFFEYSEKYCKQAHKKMIIHRIDGDALANWAYSFDNTTTEVTLYGDYGAIRLNDLFPFMTHFTVEELTKPIVQHYPHLTKCVFDIFDDDNDSSENVYEFIRLNPQLRHFHATMRKDPSYVKYLSEMLPNLESLGIEIKLDRNTIYGVTDIAHFRNVREFSLKIAADKRIRFNQQAIGNITFDHLKKFTLEASRPVFATELIRMISQNRNLQQLETNMKMNSQELLGLVRVLPALEEISFDLNMNDLFPALEALFLNRNQIKKISVQCSYINVNIKTFARIAPNSWHLVETSVNNYSFTRKN